MLFRSDGTYQYVTQAAGVIGSIGTSASVYAVANTTGTWAVPAFSINSIVSSVPTGITLTVTNPTSGIPSTSVQSPEDYRAQVLQAGLTTATGTPNAIEANLDLVPGVVPSLVSIIQNTYYSPNRWEVIVGGGDPYEVANAIYQSCGDPNTLCGSVMQVLTVGTGTTTTITTNLVTGFTAGESIKIAGATGITGINGTWTISLVAGNPLDRKSTRLNSSH